MNDLAGIKTATVVWLAGGHCQKPGLTFVVAKEEGSSHLSLDQNKFMVSM